MSAFEPGRGTLVAAGMRSTRRLPPPTRSRCAVCVVALGTALTVAACGGDGDPAERPDTGTGPLDGGGSADATGIDAVAVDAGSAGADGGEAEDGATSGSDAGGSDAGPPCAPLSMPERLTTYGSLHVPTAIAVSRDGTVGVTFSVTGGELHYGTNASGTWVRETIDLGEYLYLGTATSIAIGDGGSAHIVFRDGASSGLGHYVTNASGAWVHEPGSPSAGAGDLAVDRAGAVHVARAAGGEVVHVSNASGTWTTTTVSARSPCSNPSLEVSDGVVYMAYLCGTSAPYDVVFAESDATGTFAETLVSPAIALSLPPRVGLAGDGTARVVYQRYDDQTLRLATETAGSFSEVPLADTARLQGLAVSDAGAVHVLHGYHSPGLSYGTDASGAWSTSVIEHPWGAGLAAITMGDDGRVHVADLGARATEASVLYRYYCP